MTKHHLQKKIIADLVESESARYADLKPANIEGNVFTYHLQNLIKLKLIQKNENGSYSLTSKGKLYGINISLSNLDMLEQAHSIILLTIQDGARWLLRKRLVQPMFGKIGFIHGEPKAGEAIEQTGKAILKRRTGLDGDMKIRGSGFVRLCEGDSTISYTNFVILSVDNLQGDLISEDSHGQNIWIENPDFTSEDMIPSMQDIAAELQSSELFFIDKSYGL